MSNCNAVELKRIVELAQKVYTPEGVEMFLSTPREEFGGRSAYETILRGEYEMVLGALATDYEGLGY